MKNYFEMNEVSQEVADSLEEQLYDCKEDCKKVGCREICLIALFGQF